MSSKEEARIELEKLKIEERKRQEEKKEADRLAREAEKNKEKARKQAEAINKAELKRRETAFKEATKAKEKEAKEKNARLAKESARLAKEREKELKEKQKLEASLKKAHEADALIEAKKSQRQEELKKNPNIGFECMGFSGEDNYVWSNFKQTLYAINSKDLRPDHLNNIIGPRFIELNYTEEQNFGGFVKETVNYDALKADIINGCQAKGIYNPDVQRGAGIWLDDEGYWIVNSKEIYSNNPKFNGSRIQNNIIYEYTSDLGITKKTTPASRKELELVISLFKSFNWKNKDSANFSIGFLAQGFIVGAVGWKAHAYLYGEAGSGKTTLQKALKSLWGANSLYIDGDSSEVGIRQHLKHDALQVSIDESEPDSNKIHRVLGMLRSASDEEGAIVLRGTADQKGTSFVLKMAGMLSGIIPVDMRQADVSRFINLEMSPLTEEQKNNINPEIKLLLDDKNRCRNLGLSIQAYILDNFEHFKKIQSIVRKCFILSKNNHSERYKDTYTSIIALSYLLQNFDRITYDEFFIQTFFDSFDFTEQLQQQESKDHESLLEAIMTKEILGDDGYKMAIIENIYHAHQAYITNQIKLFKEFNSVLGKYGIRVLDSSSHLEILLDGGRSQLQALLKETRFNNGKIEKVLQRLEHSEVIKEAKMLGGIQKRNLLKVRLDPARYNFKKFAEIEKIK